MTQAGARPPFFILAVLFVVSAAMLAFEVLLVRLFEFSHWHHFAGLAVSLALLGLGAAGTCLAVLGERAARSDRLIHVGMLLQIAGMLMVLLLHARVAVRPLFAAWEVRELLRLLAVDFAAFVPFFGAGLVIGGVFTRWPAESPRLYAANLLGSGAGSVAASLALSVMYVERALVLTALLPLLVLPWLVRRGRAAALAGAVVLGAAVASVLSPVPAPAVSDFKALSRVLDLPDARLLEARAGLHGRLSVVRADSLRNAPGLSLQWTRPVPPVDAAIVGSDRLVPMPRRFPAPAAHMQASLAGLPFTLRPEGDVLVLGASAWSSLVAAEGRASVWVEPDERLLDLARARGLARSGVTGVADGTYRYLTTTERSFDLVAVDAAFMGGDAASEDYLMTAQGLAAVLSRLSTRGLLVLPLELSVPPRRIPRALATLREALDRMGVARPAEHVAVLRGLQAAVILASPRTLADSDVSAIRAFAETWRFDLVWLPGMDASEANRYHRLDTPVFHLAANALFNESPMPVAARWFERTPAELDRPYFWRSLVWSRIPDFLRSMSGPQAMSYLDWTLILTVVSAASAAFLGLVLIVTPLGRLPPAIGAPGRVAVAGFFAALGLGYMLLELVMLQRAVLFLGEPVAAAALVFAVFLIASGLGSAAAPDGARRGDALRVFAAIAAGLAVAATVLWPLAGHILALPWLPRTALLVAAIAIPAWAMGRPFPWALRQLAGRGRWVPWAWAINGFASVVAASLATLLSVQWGHGTTLALAAACYVLAAFVALAWTTDAR